jgi:aminocarboxymuconate-semialdehyde decarboxylase
MFLEDLKSYYFDTALVAPSGLPSLLEFAPKGHIVFGTDFPYVSEAVSKALTRELEASKHLSADDLESIAERATALFPRLCWSERSLHRRIAMF